MITTFQPLLNAGSKDMNVNGGTPKTFEYSPGSGTVGITHLAVVFQDDGNTPFNKFGALSALANGVLIQQVVSGNTTVLATLKDNADFPNTFTENHFGSDAVLSILGIVTPEGFGQTNNAFVGRIKFDNPVVLTDSDAIQVVIQDNISGVTTFRMTATAIQDS